MTYKDICDDPKIEALNLNERQKTILRRGYNHYMFVENESAKYRLLFLFPAAFALWIVVMIHNPILYVLTCLLVFPAGWWVAGYGYRKHPMPNLDPENDER